MSDTEEMLRAVAKLIDDGVEEEDIVLYDYVLQQLRESGLLRLLEAGERARKKINHTGNDKMCESCMVCREYDAAKAAMKEKAHA